MKYQKKSLWVLASAGMLGLAFVSGCGDDKGTTTTGKTTAQDTRPTTTGGKNYNLHTWAKVDSEFLGNPQSVRFPAVSGDNKKFYAASILNGGGHVVAIDVADFQNAAAKKESWKKIALTTPDTWADEAGSAKLVGALNAWSINPSKTGVVVAVGEVGSNANNKNGVVYINGDKLELAWRHTVGNSHFSSGLIGGLAGQDLANEVPVHGFAASSGGKEFLYLYTRNGFSAWIDTGELGPNPIKNAVDQAGGGRNTFLNPLLAQKADGAPVYIADEWGVHVIPADKIGQKANTEAVDVNTPDVGSDAWKMDDAVKNYNVGAVALVGDDLYIGLRGQSVKQKSEKYNEPLEGQGGVAVYNTKANKTVAPKKTWSGKAVIGFAVEGDTVWAVTSKGLYEANNKGEIVKGMSAETVPATPEEGKTYNAGTSVPTGITGAKFVGDTLVITSTGGISYRSKAVATPIK